MAPSKHSNELPIIQIRVQRELFISLFFARVLFFTFCNMFLLINCLYREFSFRFHNIDTEEYWFQFSRQSKLNSVKGEQGRKAKTWKSIESVAKLPLISTIILQYVCVSACVCETNRNNWQERKINRIIKINRTSCCDSFFILFVF